MKEVYALYAKYNGKEEFLGCASSFPKLKRLLCDAIKAHIIMFYQKDHPVRFYEQIHFCRNFLPDMDMGQIDECLHFAELRQVTDEAEIDEMLSQDGLLFDAGPVARACIAECEALNKTICDPNRAPSQIFDKSVT